MKIKISTLARLILGLIYFVFGLNGFFHFIPMKQPVLPETAMEYLKGLMATGYFMPVLSATQVFSGFLLLTGFAAPLALVVAAPVTLQIVLFHSFLTPTAKELILPIAMAVLHITAATAYWKIYRPLFSRG
ncbi:MAG: acyltransferase [Bacteriovoracaceae bacterium]|nr:acyltransferase [Bacteriovoracaceae bacterium]